MGFGAMLLKGFPRLLTFLLPFLDPVHLPVKLAAGREHAFVQKRFKAAQERLVFVSEAPAIGARTKARHVHSVYDSPEAVWVNRNGYFL